MYDSCLAERGNKLSSIVAEGREGAPICAEMGAPSARKDGPAMKKLDRAAMGAPSSAAIRLLAGVSMVKYVGIGHVQIIVSSTSSEPERNNRLATFAKLRSICILT